MLVPRESGRRLRVCLDLDGRGHALQKPCAVMRLGRTGRKGGQRAKTGAERKVLELRIVGSPSSAKSLSQSVRDRGTTQGWWEYFKDPTSAPSTSSEETVDCCSRGLLLGVTGSVGGRQPCLERLASNTDARKDTAQNWFSIASVLDIVIFHSRSACGSRGSVR